MKKRKITEAKQAELKKTQDQILEEALKGTLEIFNDENKFSFDHRTFVDFIKNNKTKIDALNNAKKINIDVLHIVTAIEKAYPLVNNKSIKTRLTKLKNKILQNNTEETSSETSENENDQEDDLSDSMHVES